MPKRFSWPIFLTMVLKLSQRLSEDFGKHFTPQQELAAEQTFCFRISNPTIESSNKRPIKVKVPSDLPNVSLVNASLKKLKFHLAQFDSVIKKKATPDACTEGEWRFEHTKAMFNNEIIPFLKSLKDIFNVFNKDLLKEIIEVQTVFDQTVFDQTEATVQQSSVDKQCLKIAKKELLLENDRLLQQIMSQDVLLTMMISMSLIVKGKEIVDIAAQIPSANTIVPGLSKKAKIVESKNANPSELNHTWGSNAIDIPSSSSLVMTGCPDCSLYVEGLGHNLFSVGQFCDVNLEVVFWKNTCFIRNLEGVDLLSGSRDTNLYIIPLDDMLKTSPIYLLSKVSKTKSWLWQCRLSHLNFGTLNTLAKDGLAQGIPRLKFKKDHLCSTCALGKSKKSSHQHKAKDTNQEKLYILRMDLCGSMRVASINEKRYILVSVNDYSRFTWVRFLRLKDEAPDAIIKCIKNIKVCLNATVRNVQTNNGIKFVNQTLREFYENVGISHQTSVARTP
nr:retrovirus-related Pol polyprotein from transposon TNT 1-94 [Tanacetum cinerariifolium]